MNIFDHFAEGSFPSFNIPGIEKTIKHVSKVEELVEIINSDFQKKITRVAEEEIELFPLKFMHHLKHFMNLYSLCLLELCHELQFIGLDFFLKPFLKLFHAFKLQNCVRTLLLNSKKEMETSFNESQVQEFVQYVKLTKGLTKSQIQTMTGDKYAKLEKAKFLLEQEGYELDKLLFDFKKGKDEIESLLKTSMNFRNMGSSGVSKILENILKKLKSEEFLFNYDALLKAIDKEFEKALGESLSNTDIIHVLTKKIMIKLDSNHRKKLENEKKNAQSKSKLDMKDLDFEGVFTVEKFTQTENIKSKQSIAMESLKKKKLSEAKKEEEEEKTSLLQKIKDLEFEKKFLTDKVDEKETKILKKKEKIKNLRILIDELKEKLNYFNDKDLLNMNLLRMKDNQIQEAKARYFERETQFLQKIKESQDLIAQKDVKIKELTDEISNIAIASEFNKPNNEVNLEKIDENENSSSSHSSKSKSGTNEQPSLSKSPSKYETTSLSPGRKQTTLLNPKKLSEEVITKSLSSRRNTQAIQIPKENANAKTFPKRGSVLSPMTPEKHPIRPSLVESHDRKSKNDISSLTHLDESSLVKKTPRTSILKRNSVKYSNVNSLGSLTESKAKIKKELEESHSSSKMVEEVKFFFPNPNTIDHKEDIAPKNINSSSSIQENKLNPNLNENSISSNLNITKYETPRIEVNPSERKNLKLIAKFNRFRNLKKLNSMYVRLEKPASKPQTNPEQKDAENENKLLLQILKKKNPILMFSQFIFPKNKPFQKKIELILERLVQNKNQANYFEYLEFLVKKKELPPSIQSKSVQTNIASLEHTSSQTDPLKPMFISQDPKSLIKVIDKGSKQAQEWVDFTNTTSSSLDSRTERNVRFLNGMDPPTTESRKFTSPEKFVNTKRVVANLSSSNHSKSTNQELTAGEKIGNSGEKISSTKVIKTTESMDLINRNMTDRPTKTDSWSNLKTKKTEEDHINDEPKVEELITKEVYEHIQNLSKNDDKNYSKIKFLFKYPFRSINSKFDEKKRFLEEDEKLLVCETDKDEDLNFDKFQVFFRRMVKMHKKCGVNCMHLRRFFQKIGYKMHVPPIKHEFLIPKNIINKLPKIV